MGNLRDELREKVIAFLQESYGPTLFAVVSETVTESRTSGHGGSIFETHGIFAGKEEATAFFAKLKDEWRPREDEPEAPYGSDWSESEDWFHFFYGGPRDGDSADTTCKIKQVTAEELLAHLG